MRYRHAAFTGTCALLVACGGNVVTGESDHGGSTGSGGAPGTTTGTMPQAGTEDVSPPDGFGGGDPVSTACGTVTCGAGYVCCNASCGVCTLPSEACPNIACPTPVFDSGIVPVIDAGRPLTCEGGEMAQGRSDYGYQWRDSWFIRGCQILAGHDCVHIASCPNFAAPDFEDRGAITKELFPIGGCVGTTYSVTFQVNGITEAKYYTGGSRDAGEVVQADVYTADLDMFYRGGAPVVSNYDVVRMRVLDSTGKEFGRYYLNSAPNGSGLEAHRTFAISYQKTILVPGGGTVEYLTADSNCHSIDNCGAAAPGGTTCDAPRGIPHEEANPLPAMAIDPDPANDVNGKHRAVPLSVLNSVNGSAKPWHAGIIHVTILKAVPN